MLVVRDFHAITGAHPSVPWSQLDRGSLPFVNTRRVHFVPFEVSAFARFHYISGCCGCRQSRCHWQPHRVSFLDKLAFSTSCRLAADTICPRPSPPPWAAKRLAPPSRRKRSSSFPQLTCSHSHRCSRLTRQHGGEQSGLMILNFDPLILKVVSESRVTWTIYVPILVFLDLSVLDLGPMYATDVRQTDVREHHRFMPRLLGAGHNKPNLRSMV